ncbi:MAG: glycosyltransferase family 8 protein [Thermonemataceae bacterium]
MAKTKDLQEITIHLAIAFDDNYLIPFYALVSSIFHNNPNSTFQFHCITSKVPETEKAIIKKFIKENNSNILFYTVAESDIAHFVTLNHWNTSVYYKIFFPLIIDASVKRILYLDTDTIVVGAIEALYKTDLQNQPLGAVKDPYVGINPYFDLHMRKDYFNSGVMLIDMQRWNTLSISEKTIQFLNDHPEKIIYVDQDALNNVLIEKCRILPKTYNLMYTHLPKSTSKKYLKQYLQEITIIHFTLSRPWSFLCANRYRYLYKYYLYQSPKRKHNHIQDFSFSKLFPYFRMRLKELYNDTAFLQNAWRTFKKIL